MSGVRIANELLRASPAVLAAVPAAQIRAWTIPQGTPLPSILATSISRVEQQPLARQSARLVTERVQITVRANDGTAREAILKLVRSACADRTGTIAGFAKVAVLLAGGGPDFMDDAATIFMGSTDLRISFSEPA